MNRQEFRVLTAYGYAVGPEIIPATEPLKGWNLACELQYSGRSLLTDHAGKPETFVSIEGAASVARAFGHPECTIYFSRDTWTAIL